MEAALYAEDMIKLAPRLTMSTGLRYSFQTSPNTFVNLAPRVAFSWAPDKKSTWVISLRIGSVSLVGGGGYGQPATG
jgi:hypothetical protein